MNIEELKVSELWQLQRIGEEFTVHAGLKGGFDVRIFSSNWRALIASGIGKIFIARNLLTPAEVYGCFGCIFIPDPFNGRPIALEQFFFVVPEMRGSRLGSDLMDAFEGEAAKRGCKKLLMVRLDGPGAEVLDKFYERRGYHSIEKTFSKEI